MLLDKPKISQKKIDYAHKLMDVHQLYHELQENVDFNIDLDADDDDEDLNDHSEMYF